MREAMKIRPVGIHHPQLVIFRPALGTENDLLSVWREDRIIVVHSIVRQSLDLFDNLAEVFRYILYNKERNLVLLSEELAFAEKYFSLIKIRFGSCVVLQILPNNVESDSYLIPPISLQVLLENAIKHNIFSERHPLTITMDIRDDKVIVSNDVRKKILKSESSRIGLKKLMRPHISTRSIRSTFL